MSDSFSYYIREIFSPTNLIVNRTPFGVDDHKLSTVSSTLLTLLYGRFAQLGDGIYSINVCSIGSSPKDSTDKCGSRLVRAREKGSNGVVD